MVEIPCTVKWRAAVTLEHSRTPEHKLALVELNKTSEGLSFSLMPEHYNQRQQDRVERQGFWTDLRIPLGKLFYFSEPQFPDL